MDRKVGTISMGVRCPIIRQGDDLANIVVDSVLDATNSVSLEIRDKDIISITESIVARAQGNYASIDAIADDVKNKLGGGTIGVIFPILSRNRFSICLKGIARGAQKIVLLLSYPDDEVGNALLSYEQLEESNVNPYSDLLTLEEYRKAFGNNVHEFTKVDYIEYYKQIIEAEGAACEIIFSNNPKDILGYTKDVLACDIHSREKTKKILKKNGGSRVYGLDNILSSPVNGSGYNSDYGLLGSNKATEDSVKLFPHDCQTLVDGIQNIIKEKTGKNVEVMIYGDGAFKDPKGKIWELADPVVSPAFTSGLIGVPNEVKLKYFADNDFKDLNGDELHRAIKKTIKDKGSDLAGDMATQGTTPRQFVDLIGSLSDLTSGSGDKGTPIVFVQGYFDNYNHD